MYLMAFLFLICHINQFPLFPPIKKRDRGINPGRYPSRGNGKQRAKKRTQVLTEQHSFRMFFIGGT
jgi:hypothetical protein